MSSFSEGIYSVTASVNGQYMHFTPKTLENFEINNKMNSIVEFIPKEGLKFDYLSSGTVGLYLNGCNVELANISVVGHPEAIIGIDENGFVIISNLIAGSYTLQVISTPNQGYNSVTRTTGITVNKINSYVSLSPASFDYGKSGSINMDVNGGTVELENIHVLNHPEAVISLNNNKITVSNLSAGSYTLQVTSTPDDNHIAVTENTTITVNKVDSSISLTPVSFDYGQTGTSNYNVVGGSVSRSNICVLNHPEAGINIYNNVISVSDLNAGSYTLQVTSSPDDNHNSVTKTTEIIVNKVDSTLSFTKPVSFDYGGSDSTSVDFYGCTIQSNNIKVLNHPEAIITFTGKVISVSGLDAGVYSLSVSATPDNNHNAVTRTISVTVNKIDSNVRFTRELSFNYGDSDSTVIVLDGCAVNLADISVVGHDEAVITLNDNEISVSGLDAGSYTLSVVSTPNTNYNSVTKTTKITVNRIDSSISFNRDELIFDQGDSASVGLTVDGGSIDIEDIYVGNHPEAVISLNNNAIIVSNLTYGSYSLYVASSPDKNHNAVLKILPITVNKMLSDVTFGGDIVFDYGGSGSTWVKVTGGGISPSDITVVGHSEAEITVTSNNYVYVSNLDAGFYTLKVVSTPDENHRSVEASVAIVVNKVNSSVDINDISFDYGSSATVNVNVNGGKLLLTDISIDGENNAKIMYNGKTITVSDLDAGSYTLSLVTTPDSNHEAVTATVNVNVNKVDSILSLSDDVVFDYGGSGSTVITAGGDDVSLSGISVVGEAGAEISLNNYKINVSNLDAGRYTLRVTTSPDKNHNPVTRDVNVIVNKVDSIVDISNIIIFNYGSFGTADVTVTGGNVLSSGISVDNHPEAQITLNDKTVTVLGLDAGTYVLRVISTSDKNHNPVEATASIIVNKVDGNLTLINDIVFDYGGSGSTGVIIDGGIVERSGVSVDNHNEAIIDVEGNVITVSNLGVGDYTLRVVSTPDSNHNSISKTVDVTVNKADANVSFSNELSFEYGGSAQTTLTIVGGSLTKDNICVLNHPEANITFYKNIVGVSGLDFGTYTLQITVIPDSNHNAVTKNINVHVNKIDSTLAFSNPVSFEYGESGTTTLSVVGGSVVRDGIRVLNHDEANIDLKGDVVTVSGLDVGSYTLQVSTTPDLNHNAVTKTLRVDVGRADSILKFDSDAIVFDYGGVGSVGFNVIGGTISDSRISVLNYKNANITVKDNVIYVSNLNAGSYTLQVESTPDSNHNSITKSIVVDVKRVDSNIVFNGDVISFKYGESGSIGVNVDGGSISMDGAGIVGYDGKATFENNKITVSGLDVGEYKLNVTATPDSNHNPVSASIGVVVSKTESKIGYANDIVFDYLGVGTTTLILDGCTVDSKNLEVVGYPNIKPVISMANVVSVSGLESGKYTLKVKSTPDANHIETAINIPISVNKINSKISFTKNSISFKYASTGSTPIVLENCNVATMSIEGSNVKPVLENGEISVSGLAVGNYILKVTTEPLNNNYKSVDAYINVAVTKNTAKISVEKKTFAYKKAGKWAITLKDSSGKAISNVKVTLKVYTGKQFKPYTSTASNSNGVAYFNKIKSLSLGNHKIVVSFSHAGYTCKDATSSIKVIKQTAVKIKINAKSSAKGFSISVIVKDKSGKKYLNGVKVKLTIGTGKNMKTVTLVSGKYGGGKGVCAYSTNMLPAGTHKVSVSSAVVNYVGSAKSKVTLKSSAKKHGNWWEMISNGKATSHGLK